MKISWLILTWNRAEAVEQSLTHSARNAGRAWDEIVWVDNGSDPAEREHIARIIAGVGGDITSAHFSANRGVAIGYNAALALARGTHVVITGCDMKMPDGWLDAMASANAVSGAGVISIYAQPIAATPERVRGEPRMHDGLALQPALPIGRRLISRAFHAAVGFLPECFGLYGWEDVAWAHRAERIGTQLGLTHYTLPGYTAEAVKTNGPIGNFGDEAAYTAWKKEQVENGRPLMKALEGAGWPSFPEMTRAT